MDDSPVDYEVLCRCLYAYRLGTISFIELVERLEAALHIRAAERAEVPDVKNAVRQGERE